MRTIWHRPITAVLSCLALTVPLAALSAAPAVADSVDPVASQLAAELPGIRVNEVAQHSDVTDWVELTNIAADAIDVSGWILKDDKDSRTLALPTGSIIAPGGFLAVDVDGAEQGDAGFGLGKSDMIRVFLPDNATLVDSHEWSGHTATSYGRCPDGLGEFIETASITKAAVNACAIVESPQIVINETVSTNGVPGDWVELKNNGQSAADISGYSIRDSKDDHVFVIADGTTIAAGGYFVADVDGAGGFGLGKSDEARLFAPDGATLLSSSSWSAHAATSYGRCPDGTGDFAITSAATRGGPNECGDGLVTRVWPGGPAVATADEANVLGDNMSGLAVEATASGEVLWAAKNGTGTLHRLLVNTSAAGAVAADDAGITVAADQTNGWGSGKVLHFADGTGDVDAEGVALTGSGAAGGVFVVTERDNDQSRVSRLSVLRFDVSTSSEVLNATTEWNLTADLPAVGANAGLEGITWLPDDFLVSGGFLDEARGGAYDPAVYPGHGDGLFFVGVEASGMIYGYALLANGEFARVASFSSGFAGVMDLEFDAERAGLWAACDDTCDGRSALLTLQTEGPDAGVFAVATVFERPADMPNLNNEGFALASATQCINGVKPAYWADDNNTDGHAIRVGAIECIASDAPAEPTEPGDPGTPTDPTEPGEPTKPVEPGTPTDPSGSNNPAAGSGSGDSLAATGADLGIPFGAAALALIAGGLLLLARRRTATE